MPFSVWGYALEIVNYILNLFPSKFVALTPSELLNRRKPSLRIIRVWGCPANVLNEKKKINLNLEQKYAFLLDIQRH